MRSTVNYSLSRSVSIIIPTFNRPNLALKATAIIRKFHPDVQITIVDQLSREKPDQAQLNKLNTKYININIENTSIAKNRGIKESSGDIIFFFDDDIEITENTIPEQLKEYKNSEVVGTCGRVINDFEKIPEKTDVVTGKMNWLGSKFIQQFWSTKRQFIDFPYGCNMSFRASVLKKVGGFDERFPKIFEEIDLGIRVGKYGVLSFVPAALAYHHKAKSGGTRTDVKNKMRMIYRNYGLYIAKNVFFPGSLITLALRTRTVFHEAPFAITDLFKGYFSYFFLKKNTQ